MIHLLHSAWVPHDIFVTFLTSLSPLICTECKVECMVWRSRHVTTLSHMPKMTHRISAWESHCSMQLFHSQVSYLGVVRVWTMALPLSSPTSKTCPRVHTMTNDASRISTRWALVSVNILWIVGFDEITSFSASASFVWLVIVFTDGFILMRGLSTVH